MGCIFAEPDGYLDVQEIDQWGELVLLIDCMIDESWENWFRKQSTQKWEKYYFEYSEWESNAFGKKF